MIEWLLEAALGLATGGASFAVPGAGAAIATVGSFFAKRSVRIIAVLIGVILIGGTIGIMTIKIARQDATIKEQRASVEIANERLDQSHRAQAMCTDLAQRNAAAVAAERERSRAALEEVSATLRGALARKEQIKVVKERVHVRIAECPPGAIPPGLDAALDELERLRRAP